MKRLAVGGMAELFLAQEPPSPELVVLKRILPYLSEEPEFVQMFLDEARIAAQLHHPNIVQVYELGKLDNTIFIAMEFVEGVDLRRVVQEENKFGATVPYGVAAAICAQVAQGLDYAHFSKGVDGIPLELIHRDVSPQNVMIAYDGRVKIVDFGIAKAGTYVNRSKPGVIKGKFLYLAPEQVAQEKLDHRTDIFALGTMMYEITTGKSPFAKPTTEGILYAIRSEDPSPPHLLKDDYPTELSRIIMRCLVKDRNQRYQRASEVQRDLEAFLASGVIKQSTDISDYIARLMGEEEERTVLHIPVASAAKKDATRAMAPGLTARPGRRITGEGVPAPPSFDNEPEPPTQMARPREILAQKPPVDDTLDESIEAEVSELGDTAEPTGNQPAEFDDEEEMSTAIGTVPVGFVPPPLEPGESTVQERKSGRTSSSKGTVVSRRPTPPVERDTEPRARRPVSSPSRPKLADAEVDPSNPSISLTQPTGTGGLFEDEGEEQEELGEVEAPDTDERGAESISVTPPATGHRRRVAEAASQPPVSSTTGQRRRVLDEPSSASLSEPTVNQRNSRQRQVLRQEEEEPANTESGLSEMDDDSYPTEGIRSEPEDDESTAGYDQELEERAPQSRWLWVAVVVAVALVIGGLGIFWALRPFAEGTGESNGPPPPQPVLGAGAVAPTKQPAPPSEANPATPTEGTPTETEPPAGSEAVAAAQDPAQTDQGQTDPAGTSAAGEQDNPAGGALAAADTEGKTPEEASSANPGTGENPLGTSSTKTGGGETKVKPTGPLAEVKFKTNFALIKVNDKKVEPNKVLTYPAGRIELAWWCPPKKKREGSTVKVLKAGQRSPQVIEIRCKKNYR
ncbi:serine/threonine protein kinase [Hyalangium minutum]|uniref:serine/threonine protein kinase n=1 Tax=Hyalangium minutum TaxID=394096 RepID=UPI0030840D6B